MTTFDVAGTVTLKQVYRANRNESWAEAMHRLAKKAVIEGCMIWGFSEDRTRATVTSSRNFHRVYNVTADAEAHTAVCNCAGFEVHKLCKHGSLVLAELGALPPLDTAPLPAKFPGIDARTGEPIQIGDLITRTERGWTRVAA